jgi:hypothetical protein
MRVIKLFFWGAVAVGALGVIDILTTEENPRYPDRLPGVRGSSPYARMARSQAAEQAAFKLRTDRRIVAEDTAKASCNFPATFKQSWLGGTTFNESGRVARVTFTCTNGFGVPSEHVMQILFAENSADVLSAEMIQ